MKNRIFASVKSISTLFLSVLFVLYMTANTQLPPSNQNPGNTKIITLIQADELQGIKEEDAQILRGNVVLFHQGAYMYCDSAYRYMSENSFEAFGNVQMEQGDTIFVYGDYLYYDGNTRLAQLRYNIRMEDQYSTLFTDSLNYDRIENVGYYFEGGMIVDDRNELTSYWGQYSPDTKDAIFSDSVKLVNEQYTIYADTLKYNTETQIANLLGPSTIVSDSGFIYTTNGWYNTVTDDAELYNRSEIYSKDGTKVLVGDTIFYNRQTGDGEAFGRIHLQDFERKAILKGNYATYNEKSEVGMATDSAYVIEYSQKDSLFLHGDTLRLMPDSIYKDIHAYYNVRFYRTDIQGVCDSMTYSQRDSVLYMIDNPVIWNKSNQVFGNIIEIHMNDSTVDKAIVKDYAFAIQDRQNDEQYNQISGKQLTASFDNNELRYVLVEGSAESIYYLVEEDNTMIGMNRTQSPYLSIDIMDDEVQKIKFWPATTATTTPLSQLKTGDEKLKGFIWLHYLRPINKNDIFRSNSRQKEDAPIPPRKFLREETTE